MNWAVAHSRVNFKLHLKKNKLVIFMSNWTILMLICVWLYWCCCFGCLSLSIQKNEINAFFRSVGPLITRQLYSGREAILHKAREFKQKYFNYEKWSVQLPKMDNHYTPISVGKKRSRRKKKFRNVYIYLKLSWFLISHWFQLLSKLIS